MPLDLGPLAWGWLALVALGAAFVRGYSGFGFAALLIAGAALVTPPVALVPAVILCDIALTAPQWTTIRGSIDWRRVALLFGGCLLGVPLGVRAVALMGEDTARIVVHCGAVSAMSQRITAGTSATGGVTSAAPAIRSAAKPKPE